MRKTQQGKTARKDVGWTNKEAKCRGLGRVADALKGKRDWDVWELEGPDHLHQRAGHLIDCDVFSTGFYII